MNPFGGERNRRDRHRRHERCDRECGVSCHRQANARHADPHREVGLSMATGWAGDGAVQDQIDATIKDGVNRARSKLPQGTFAEPLRRMRRGNSASTTRCLRGRAAVCGLSGARGSGRREIRRLQPARQQGQPSCASARAAASVTAVWRQALPSTHPCRLACGVCGRPPNRRDPTRARSSAHAAMR